jgi:protein XRP2
MGQHCTSRADTAPSTTTTTAPRGGAPRAATKYSYQSPGARREKQDPPYPQSRDPDDYQSTGLKDATWTRLPGQVNDQRINIENATNTSFLLLDNCDSVQVDDCVGCTFYIGPTTGSVFLRGCKDCKAVIICGQLRLRDVKNTDIALFCRSRPVIESSRNVGIGCFAGPQYLDMRWQMARSALSVWNNLYYFVHDFTPHPDSWHPLDRAQCTSLITTLSKSTEYISEDEERMAAVLPWTRGPQSTDKPAYVTVVGRAGWHDEMEAMLHEWLGKDSSCVLETGEIKLDEDAVKGVLRVAPLEKLQLKEGDVVTVMTIDAGSVVVKPLAAVKAREAVLLAVGMDDGAASLREALLGRAGSGSGFGTAF